MRVAEHEYRQQPGEIRDFRLKAQYVYSWRTAHEHVDHRAGEVIT
jgi:hypothetical protein